MKFKIILPMFFICLTIFTVGFAFLSSSVRIEGIASIDSVNWNVYLDNINVSKGSVEGSVDVVDNNINYTFLLKIPGDYYEFTIDVINDGTIDAMIDSIDNNIYLIENNKLIKTNLPNYLNYSITYKDNNIINKNDLLNVNDTKSYRIRIEFNKDINNNDLPKEGFKLKFNSIINYIQA